jgi:hypothetical protein
MAPQCMLVGWFCGPLTFPFGLENSWGWVAVPIPLPLVDEPVVDLLQLQACLLHKSCFLILLSRGTKTNRTKKKTNTQHSTRSELPADPTCAFSLFANTKQHTTRPCHAAQRIKVHDFLHHCKLPNSCFKRLRWTVEAFCFGDSPIFLVIYLRRKSLLPKMSPCWTTQWWNVWPRASRS